MIGAGPVGLAALWYAHRHGIDAIALDAGHAPLDSVRAFGAGLVTVSTAHEWEIDGLPVDCAAPTEVTREDLLSYYARVGAYGGLEVAYRQRVTAIAVRPEAVRIDVESFDGPSHWLARRVIVTPWFRRRRLALEGSGVTVVEPATDATSLVEPVVVVGAGMSGLESCDQLLRRGRRVTLLDNRRRRLPAELQALFKLSGSRYVDSVESIAIARPNVLVVSRKGSSIQVPCAVAVNCTGLEVNRDLLAIVRDAGLLSETEMRALERFRPLDVSDRESREAAAAQLPALSDAIWRGRRGVHFAGTVFHIGGARGAGIMWSIETARWAVAAIAGKPDVAVERSSHLPTLLLNSKPSLVQRGLRWSKHLAAIVPTPIPAWSRGTKLFEGETPTGGTLGSPSHDTRAHGVARRRALTDLREACYSGRSVGALVAALGIDRDVMLRALGALWTGNGLTWIPPAASRRSDHSD